MHNIQTNPGARGMVTALVGGQWGSEGKGAIAAFMANETMYDLAISNAGAQAGHTFYDMDGMKKVTYHLPVATALTYGEIPAYLTAGAIINLDTLIQEVEDLGVPYSRVTIHPRAAIITEGCVNTEAAIESHATGIASTRKGVGEALSRKVKRELTLAAGVNMPFRCRNLDLNDVLHRGHPIFMEVPQGFDLSINHGSHYPHCTSRDCFVTSALSDAGIHPRFLGHVSMVVRTFPIRVGNIQVGSTRLGYSGDCWPDQQQITFEGLGVPDEFTTVTKRKRRIFTFSKMQYKGAVSFNRPNRVFLTFCNYCQGGDLMRIRDAIYETHSELGISPRLAHQWGPMSKDIQP